MILILPHFPKNDFDFDLQNDFDFDFQNDFDFLLFSEILAALLLLEIRFVGPRTCVN